MIDGKATGVELVRRDGYDRVFRLELGSTVGFLSIHRLIGGRSFGGIRIKPYADEDAAESDARRLSMAMTRKTVIAGIRGGGAKTVIMEPKDFPPELRAIALVKLSQFIESLDGSYYCGGDLGFTSHDLAHVRNHTRYVACGDLAVHSARSVVECLLAVSRPEKALVQGLGSIGQTVFQRLASEGIHVMGTDVRHLPEFPNPIDPKLAFETPCDAFLPCAEGGLIDKQVVSSIPCRIICGGANNPLADESLGDDLHRRGILYIPDFISNAGATVYGASNAIGEQEHIEARLQSLPELTKSIVERSHKEDRSPLKIALEIIDQRLTLLT